MKDLVVFLIQALTGKKDFEVVEKTEGDKSDFIVRAPKELMGLLIGKHGATIKALRNVIKIKATLDKKLVYLSIEEII